LEVQAMLKKVGKKLKESNAMEVDSLNDETSREAEIDFEIEEIDSSDEE
jgi:hypothetical protein